MAKLLVVEDDRIIQNILRLNLENQGHQVLLAENGREGVKLAKNELPDLILMDLRLPVLNGWDATAILKANEPTQHIPIIALTAQTTADDLRRCLTAGCDAFMAKPIDFPQLFTKIASLLVPRSTT
jgi:two-component system cell cycle response regulator DivK